MAGYGLRDKPYSLQAYSLLIIYLYIMGWMLLSTVVALHTSSILTQMSILEIAFQSCKDFIIQYAKSAITYNTPNSKLAVQNSKLSAHHHPIPRFWFFQPVGGFNKFGVPIVFDFLNIFCNKSFIL